MWYGGTSDKISEREESDVIDLTHDVFVNRKRFWRDRATHMENVVNQDVRR